LSTVALEDGTGRAEQTFSDDQLIFAHSLAAGDFNNDGYCDLAVGVPRESVGSTEVTGAVNVIYGSASGLSPTSVPDQFWSQASAGIEDFPEGGGSMVGEYFGTSVATGDYNGDGYDDMAIGVPGEWTSSLSAGAVNVIYGSSSGGLRATAAGDGTGRADQIWHQNIANVEDTAEDGDGFGSSLA
jgi:hypothetical protein